MKDMVIGFAFREQDQAVLLIEKIKPPWQHGRINGVGGKVELGESADQAMTREFLEETDVRVLEGDWVMFCRLYDATYDGNLWIYKTMLTQDQVAHVNSITDEQLRWMSTIIPLPSMVIGNLHWLVPMAQCRNTYMQGFEGSPE